MTTTCVLLRPFKTQWISWFFATLTLMSVPLVQSAAAASTEPTLIAHYMEKILEREEEPSPQQPKREDRREREIGDGENTLRSEGFQQRLLCRIRGRYNDPATLEITRERLAERVADTFGIATLAAHNILKQRTPCTTYPVTREPYLFYAGSHEPNEQAIEPAVPERVTEPPAVLEPSREIPRSVSSAVQTTSTSSAQTQQETPGAAMMQRLLCRIQERGQREASVFTRSIPTIAAEYAERWSLEADVIAAALRNNELCTESDPTVFFPSVARSSTGAQRVSSVGPGAASSNDRATATAPSGTQGDENAVPSDEQQSWYQTTTQRLRQLPTTVLIVAGMAILTFIALIILLLAPFLRSRDER